MQIQLNANFANTGVKIMQTISKLGIRKGRPNIICGDSAAGKSILCAWIGLGIAGGSNPLLANSEKGKRVTVLDLEQEPEDIISSYSRILNGMVESDPSIFNAIQENITILQERGNYFEDSYDELKQYCFDSNLLIIDNLSRIRCNLKDSIDENSQDMGKLMERLTKLSTDTNCSIILIHHNSKHGSDRGSTAIGNGAGQMFNLENSFGKFKLSVSQDRFNCPVKKVTYELSDCGHKGINGFSELRFVNVVESGNSTSSLDDSIFEIVKASKGLSQSDILVKLREANIQFKNALLKTALNKLEKEKRIITVSGKGSGGRNTILYTLPQNAILTLIK